MPSSDAALELLRSLQRDLMEPRTARDAAIDSYVQGGILSALSDDQRRAAAAEPRLLEEPWTPTEFEHPQAYSILSELADEIVALIREDRAFEHPPLVGTLPLRWPAAWLVNVPDSLRDVAVVDVQFTTFANLLAKACAQALMPPRPNASAEEWRTSLNSGEHPGVQRFLELMLATMTRTPSAAPAYLPADEWSGLAAFLRTAIELFVLADPFVHVALRHSAGAELVDLTTVHPEMRSYLFSQAQRTRCFFLRVALTAGVLKRHGYQDTALAYWGLDMFLFTIALLQGAQSLRRGDAPEEDTWAEQERKWLVQLVEHPDGPGPRAARSFGDLAPVQEIFAKQLLLAIDESNPEPH